MKIIYFDTIAGISGDMTLGAFISAGIRIEDLISELEKLNLSGFELTGRHIERSGIVATKIDVVVTQQPRYKRHLKDINQLIDVSFLSPFVKETAKKIFYELAIAEAKVHDSTVEKIHFHEVGAIDSIVDIVGTAICLEGFGIEQVFSSPIKLGHGGFVKTQHGEMPIPTPATIEILKDYPTLLTDIGFELTTPTGAAIIKALSRGMLSFEKIKITHIGYGTGTKELERIPNLLRIFIGEMVADYDSDELVTIETNIDNMNPEIYPSLIESLLDRGALDAYLVPTIMKKGRPGILLSVLAPRSKVDELSQMLFRETSTFGLRIHPVERKKLPRVPKEILTSLGLVKAKAVQIDNREVLVPEFEECKRIAREKNRPLLEVYRILERDLRKDLS